jgi:hypothetical protein
MLHVPFDLEPSGSQIVLYDPEHGQWRRELIKAFDKDILPCYSFRQ